MRDLGCLGVSGFWVSGFQGLGLEFCWFVRPIFSTRAESWFGHWGFEDLVLKMVQGSGYAVSRVPVRAKCSFEVL